MMTTGQQEVGQPLEIPQLPSNSQQPPPTQDDGQAYEDYQDDYQDDYEDDERQMENEDDDRYYGLIGNHGHSSNYENQWPPLPHPQHIGRIQA
jgi:hypothetical protein